ncbi:MAG: hypothetical protein MOGMAGMI_02494 [Candidatus Omnitrophica bacterium]|nr:hypothetical protein [Candidatus Omnitrophota bacterium]
MQTANEPCKHQNVVPIAQTYRVGCLDCGEIILIEDDLERDLRVFNSALQYIANADFRGTGLTATDIILLFRARARKALNQEVKTCPSQK